MKFVGRPKSERSDAQKVGYKLMPDTIEKIEQLSEDLHISKSELVERAVKKLNETLPIQKCSCGAEFKAAKNKELCLSCERKQREGV